MKKLKQRPAHEIICIAILIMVFLYIGFQATMVILQNHFPDYYPNINPYLFK